MTREHDAIVIGRVQSGPDSTSDVRFVPPLLSQRRVYTAFNGVALNELF